MHALLQGLTKSRNWRQYYSLTTKRGGMQSLTKSTKIRGIAGIMMIPLAVEVHKQEVVPL